MLPHADDQAAIAPAVAPPAAPATTTGGLAGFRLYWLISLGVIILDQLAKAIVRATLPLFDSVTVIPGLMDFIHVRNAGVAFGFLNDLDLPHKGLFTTALAAIALGGIAFYARHVRPEERLARIGLSLVLGGAVGNLADRLRVHYVIDFVDVYVRGWHFWAFNLADASITIGAILIFADLLLIHPSHASHPVSDR